MQKLSLFSLVIILVAFGGCRKEQTRLYLSDRSEIMEQVRYDPDFIAFLDGSENIVAKLVSSGVSGVSLVNEKQFVGLWEKAVSGNDQKARDEVAQFMGFSNSFEFWSQIERNRIARKKLQEKYDLTKLSKSDWIELNNGFFMSFRHKSVIIPSVKNPGLFNDLKAIETEVCADQQAACRDEALGTYAVEQVACVGAGALGWTIIGGLIFVACEAASNYHLQTMRAACDANYRVCIAQKPH